MKKIEIHSDGSCLGNPGKGGYAAIILFAGHKKIISGGAKVATNNQMELLAVIKGLEALKEPCEIDLYSDSKYVLNGLETWIHNWKKNNWKGSTGPVKNVELWKELDELHQKHKINFHWVKGHNGDPLNEEVDKLARDEAQKA